MKCSVLLIAAGLLCALPEAQADEYHVGVAKVDITPAYPIRLNGFGFRRDESEGVTQPIWAKAIAIGADQEQPAVLFTIDSLGLRESLVDEVAARLKAKAGIRRERIAVTFTHSHTTPKLNGACDTIFSSPIPPEHQAHIDRYSAELTDALEKVALEALADRKPSRLEWAVGKVGFAVNRRTAGGPVDHDLPMLVVRSADDDSIRAIYVTYACHCVTLSDNKISGDWAGFAQQAMELKHPGAVALVSIGCGSDANPSSGVTGANTAAAADQGGQIADEVERLLAGSLKPISGKLTATLNHIELPLNPPPSREELEKVAAQPDATAAYNAQYQLARLERGEPLLTALNYPIQSWAFGDSLSMVFLAGEVCVDYSLRLKEELDRKRVWVHGYSNDFCAYIPSERLLKEGGYGGGAEIGYFGLPNTLAPGLEDHIIADVHLQVPDQFEGRGPRRQAQSSALPPEQALASLKVRDGFIVELAAAEPLVADPVAIDFGPDGRLWVADMTDYAHDIDAEFEPSSSIRVLTDRDGDGRYDEAATFYTGLRFPTDVKAWRKGVIVCDAPDVIYLEDADGDGKAETKKTLLTGFATHNAQARVNSLRWGLDNWLYGSGGIFGGRIKNASGKEFQLGARDFRFQPDTGQLEPVTGTTQQGRDRDDWGNWFGCDNSTLMEHYPLADHYLARNPHVAPPATEVFVPVGDDPNALYPVSVPTLFKLSGPPGRPTAACGIGIYRDKLLGAEFANNAFVAESVNNLVHRRVLSAKGATFRGERAKGEADAEFLASTDTWFRPVQIRTGPDGCLWIVDMHRAVIEHKRWIPEEEIRELDLNAGRREGRIYRVRPRDTPARPIARLDQLDAAGLAAAIDSPNGPQRDLAHQMLVERRATDAAPALRKLALEAKRPATRLQALCALDGLNSLDAELLLSALADGRPAVRRHAIRLSEARLSEAPQLADAVLRLAGDEDSQVRLQLAYSLRDLDDPRAAKALADLAWVCHEDPYVLAGVWTSVGKHNVAAVVRHVFQHDGAEADVPAAILDPTLTLALKLGDVGCLETIITAINSDAIRNGDSNEPIAAWRLSAAAELLEHARQQANKSSSASHDMLRQLAPVITAAQRSVEHSAGDDQQQLTCLRILAASNTPQEELLPLLANLLSPQSSPAVQQAAARIVASLEGPHPADVLFNAWSGFTPATRAAVFDLLLGQRELVLRLLERITAGEVRTGDLDAFQRQRLLTHAEEAIRTRAAAALAGSIDANRDKIVQSYVAAPADAPAAARGREIFQKHCSACHFLEGHGHHVGPDLAALTSRTRPALLEAIFDPNRAVDERYQTYTALTVDGLAHAGLLEGETSTSVTLLEQEGKTHTLLRTELESLANSGKSLMPEGFERDISPQDAADLLAYLVAQGHAAKRFEGNKPEKVVADYDGTLWLLATNCEIYGDHVVFEAPFKNIGYWHGQNDYVAWNVELDGGGEYDVYLDWACASDSAGNAAIIEGGAPPLQWVVASTGTYDQYQTVRLGRTKLAGGKNRIIVRPDGPLTRPHLMDLRGLYLVPAGASPDHVLLGNPPPGGRDAATAVARLLKGLAIGTPAEYERIPAIWKHAIAAGKRNDAAELTRLLDLSLPKEGEPLADWQAVVIGGGLINGISQVGAWPGQRLAELLRNRPDLRARWNRVIELSRAMADDASIREGTRYDALRILGVDDFERSGEQLVRYLAPGVHEELQMGAVSGLADVQSPHATAALIEALPRLSQENRNLAINGLLRTEDRKTALAKAMADGKIAKDELSAEQLSKLGSAR